ncbi:putative small subunit terminase [Lactiplantibacillus plantarum]|nr:putative small subunit terminase [Lactiplantibacillus plantarum]
MKSDKIRQLTTFYSLPKKQQKTIMLLFSGEMNGSLSIKWTVFMKLVAF